MNGKERRRNLVSSIWVRHIGGTLVAVGLLIGFQLVMELWMLPFFHFALSDQFPADKVNAILDRGNVPAVGGLFIVWALSQVLTVIGAGACLIGTTSSVYKLFDHWRAITASLLAAATLALIWKLFARNVLVTSDPFVLPSSPVIRRLVETTTGSDLVGTLLLVGNYSVQAFYLLFVCCCVFTAIRWRDVKKDHVSANLGAISTFQFRLVCMVLSLLVLRTINLYLYNLLPVAVAGSSSAIYGSAAAVVAVTSVKAGIIVAAGFLFMEMARRSSLDTSPAISVNVLNDLPIEDGIIEIGQSDERVLDVVFVHGLGGDAVTTWHPKGMPDAYFPRWIAEDVTDVGVWSIEYDAAPSRLLGHSSARNDAATNISLKLQNRGIGDRPIVFITHSLGGLVVKQLLRNGFSHGDKGEERILNNTVGIVFLATPHAGSLDADFVDEWNYIFRNILQTTVSLKELRFDSPELRDLHAWFLAKIPGKIRTATYMEDRALPGRSKLVVTKTAADAGIVGEKSLAVSEDHLSISKPRSKKSQVYQAVMRKLKEWKTESSSLFH